MTWTEVTLTVKKECMTQVPIVDLKICLKKDLGSITT